MLIPFSPEAYNRGMGKIVVTEFVSLDGVFEDPGGSEGSKIGGWTFKFSRGPDGDKFKLDETMASDCLLLGRVTYEGFAEAWPKIKDESGFADKFNSMPKYVVSKTLKKADWNNSTIISDNVIEEINKLRQKPGGDVTVHGSGKLVKTLMENDLVDEYHLMVFPVVLGGGRKLFNDLTERATLKLVSTKTVGPDGVVVLTYHPAKK
jgi:dihydrofolate reductase